MSPNPDPRPLPPGWITQYDSNYGIWYYVNTTAQPPVTTWEHPLGPANRPPPPAANYGALPGPPPPSNHPPYGRAPGYGNNPPQGYGGYGNYPQPQYGRQEPAPPQRQGMSTGAKVGLGLGAAALGAFAVHEYGEYKEEQGERREEAWEGRERAEDAWERREYVEDVQENAYEAGLAEGREEGYDAGFDAGYDDAVY